MRCVPMGTHVCCNINVCTSLYAFSLIKIDRSTVTFINNRCVVILFILRN